ncbi:bacillithiol system redox-active protein YtxJ [Flavobacterium sp.]|uniref:bacillithiol system redox-active protein YtxJ n=1 Tax=Flavobacterium sp. TaxID=239 RepID=UPI0039E5B9FB
MGLFQGLFGNSNDQPEQGNVDWNSLHNISQLQEIMKDSSQKPAIIFKHSTRCGISRMTLRRFEQEFGLQDKVTPYFLDLLAHRDVSDAISQQFYVQHQSPQLLLIVDGKCVYNESHEGIDAAELGQRL